MAVTFSASAIFRAVDMISAPARRMESSMSRMNRAMGGLKTAAMGLAGGLAIGSLVTTATSAMTDYNQSVRSLQAITGLTGKTFIPFEKEIKNIGNELKLAYPTVSKAMELMGSLDATLLENAKDMGAMTRAAILLSKASGADLPETAQSLTSILKIFGDNASQAARYVDILSTSEQKGTYTVSQLADGLKTVGGTARVLGLNVDETAALLQALAPSSKSVEVASTGLNAILNKLGVTTGQFNPKIVGSAKAFDNLAKANLTLGQAQKLVGAERAGMLLSLINQNKVVQDLSNNQYLEGNAMAQAATRATAFNVRIEQLGSRFKNLMITGSETSGILNIFGGILGLITNNLGLIIGVIGGVIAYYIAYKTITLAITAVTIAKNVALGVSIAMHGGLIMALKGNVVALNTLKIVTGIATAAQWLFNTSLFGCPIIWIIAGIMALVGVIILLVKYWDKIKAKVDEFSKSAIWQILSLFNPIMKIVELIAFMQDRWQGIKKAFSEGGFLEGIKAIGRALLSFFLKPLEVILGAVGKITGAKWALDATKQIGDIRGVLDTGLVKEKPVNKDAAVLESKKTIESNNNQNLKIDINDPNNRANVSGNLQAIPVMVNSTRRF
jgi:TP901 family phage tail tape measure protein